MGKVILGAIVGAGIGLLLGSLPGYSSARWEFLQPDGRYASLDLARLLSPLSMMIGAAAGGIIGAIAGRVAADPNSTPLPVWVPIAVLVIFVGVALLGTTLFLWPRDSKIDPQNGPDGAQIKQQAPKPDPGPKESRPPDEKQAVPPARP